LSYAKEYMNGNTAIASDDSFESLSFGLQFLTVGKTWKLNQAFMIRTEAQDHPETPYLPYLGARVIRKEASQASLDSEAREESKSPERTHRNNS
jgi:hypothetical protein